MTLSVDKIDDVVAEAMKPVFNAYVGNLAGGMEPKEAMKHLDRGLAILKNAEEQFRDKVKEIWT